MDALSLRRTRAVLAAGSLYTVAALVTTALADGAATTQIRDLWRLSAFVVSGIVALLHVLLERVSWDQPPRSAAVRVGLGAALGGLGIALAANINDVFSADGYRPTMLIALVAWPLITGLPALVAAWVIAAAHRRLMPGKPPG